MKVLVIKLGALGDVVMATSLLRAIQDHHPGADIHLLTAPAFAGLFDSWQGISVMAFPRKGAMYKTLGWVRRQHFDVIYDLQSSDRSGLFCALSGAKTRIGNHPRFPYTHHPQTKYTGQCHIFERMQEVLASAGIDHVAERPELPASNSDKALVQEWLSVHDLLEQRPVLMHAGASPTWPSKRWPFYEELALTLAKRGIRTLWIGAGDDAELNRQLADSVGMDATGAFSIPQLAELGRHSRCAVVNDSGPMHILSASSIPVFAFFGPTSHRRNHALGQAQNVLCAEVDCSPCSLGICPTDRGHQCMHEVGVNQVLDRLETQGLI